MNERKWVQHISGVGEKWEVDSSRTYADDTDYCVRAKLQNTRSKLHWLPKSEYRRCEPPERWEDVTGECEMMVGCELDHRHTHVSVQNGYRLRKVGVFVRKGAEALLTEQWAFIVERKVTG